ncbi:MAG: TetR/AcrR family transcriptional regulator; helix-turn-helix transcriptional regulator, partial [Oscillospiraceae bacterium]|nr:TetR/AcrR family transcriptional regulator; helix-turn-helix transcriptional regulator [Oscillospiraceae bacterium]
MSTATKLFYEKGFAAVTVKEICDAGGMAKSLFYYYYVDKKDLSTQMLRVFLAEAYKYASNDGKYSALSEDEENRSIFYDAFWLSIMKDERIKRIFSEAVYEMPEFWFSGNGITFGASQYAAEQQRLTRKGFDMISSYIGALPLMLKRLIDIEDTKVSPEEFLIYTQYLERSFFNTDTRMIRNTVTRQVETASENLIDLSSIF